MCEMIESLGPEIPSADELRGIRESLGLSQAELASVLGFSPTVGDKVVRDWENGIDGRTGQPFRPTNVAWAALRYAVMLSSLYRSLPAGDRRTAVSKLIPEILK